MKYVGLDKTKLLLTQRSNVFRAQHEPAVGVEINLTGEATSIPLLKDLKHR